MEYTCDLNEKPEASEELENAAEGACGHDEICGSEPGRRYSYRDALRGEVPVPQTINGATVFKVLMVGGMVTFMVTVNGVRHTGFEFLAQSHWLYPLMFCLAFLVRTYIGDAIVGAVAPRTVLKWFDGVKRNIAMTALNVLCMAPIMCAIATLLLNGVHGYLAAYITTLPIIIPIAFTVNYFAVAPIVKLLFNNRITPSSGMQFLQAMRENTPSLTSLLGF